MSPSSTGYSGTPLAKKLGIVEGSRVVTLHAPDGYTRWLSPIPSDVVFEGKVTPLTDIVHVFSTGKAELKVTLETLRNAIKPSGTVWVSWPKKTSKLPTDITDNTIREVALPLGFVDIKVCAVSDVWSGLKLVIRKEQR
ncbi:DUF3052 domain-containing protein [Dyella sp. GSA-30]|uniref:DUF3052 domain-containing protein n=1 Tax=Dyella sp. GSA-30 TaxID=2994496 RepID=UPI0024929395|nr:DUF3052 domain-containing protein [Dyella sp. GSA-30]BDU18815.1 DUF3052 domain-containing protein [Dyella sp. GSA-30]